MAYESQIMNADEAAAPGTSVVTNSTIESIVAARDGALRTMADAAAQLEAAYDTSRLAFELRSTASGGSTFGLRDRTKDEHYGHLSRGHYDGAKSLDVFRQELDASVWQGLFERTGLFELMDHTAREEWRQSLMGNVPEVTLENVHATMESVGRDAGMIFRRGLAVAFTGLDRRFRSHDGFKIGSRMIITRLFNEWGSMSYDRKARETIADVERVMAKLDGESPDAAGLYQAVEESRGRGMNPRQSVTESRYFRLKGFKNGNAHLWFTRDDLVEKANKMLAEYYGQVIPDAVDRGGAGAGIKTKSGLPSKDLQFYFTPEKAAAHFLRNFSCEQGARILEPSAGTGHLVRPLLAAGACVDAIEIDAGRCALLRLERHPRLRVIQGNFLTTHPQPIYSAVVMNPPFYGTHWMEHVMHAFDFLRPGGTLHAILPASAEDGETAKHEEFRAWAQKQCDRYDRFWFREMPMDSFAEAGTRINTVSFELRKQR